MAYKMFHITEDDIQQGRREHCTRCPVARAVSRAVGATVYVSGINELSTGRIEYLTRDGRRVVKDLPQKVGEKIRCYDKTGVMAPFVFAVHIEGDGNTPSSPPADEALCDTRTLEEGVSELLIPY